MAKRYVLNLDLKCENIPHPHYSVEKCLELLLIILFGIVIVIYLDEHRH